jgi:YbgC/YbaW family acyl-CoA thioester hydrolase
MNVSTEENIEWNVYEMVAHWHECDPAGIAFHGNYLFWLERAFASLLSHGGYDVETKGLIRNTGFPVTLIECRFLKPIAFGSRVKVCMATSPKSDLRKLVISFRIVMAKTEEVAAEGEIHRRFVDLKSFQPVECPEELKGVFGIG